MTSFSKAGSKMNPATRTRIVEVLTNPDYDGLPQVEVADKIGISERTLYNYLTPEVWAEIRRACLEVMYRSLALVDRAVFYKASQGDVQAAKLIYARWDDMKNSLPADLHNLGEVDDAIAGIQQRIDQLEHPTDPEAAEAATAAEETRPAAPEPFEVVSAER